MTDIEHIQARLKEPNLPEPVRAEFKKILAEKTYHGFHVGERIQYGSNGEGTVITVNEARKLRNKEPNPAFVPVLFDNGYCTGIMPEALSRANLHE